MSCTYALLDSVLAFIAVVAVSMRGFPFCRDSNQHKSLQRCRRTMYGWQFSGSLGNVCIPPIICAVSLNKTLLYRLRQLLLGGVE
jgi:hypothetical protein